MLTQHLLVLTATTQAIYMTAMKAAVQEKKKKFLGCCEEEMVGSFITPLVCIVIGVSHHREFAPFMKRVAAALAGKWRNFSMRRW